MRSGVMPTVAREAPERCWVFRSTVGWLRRGEGYSVIPEARGCGYATEIVAALVDRAFADPGVQVVIAHAAESDEPSTRVLLRCGFRRGRLGMIGYRVTR